MKSKEQIKKELAECYWKEEAWDYDEGRVKDPRRKIIFEIQKEITSSFLKSAGKNNILDVACGTGRFFPLYAPRKIYGVDISRDMLNEARKKKLAKELKLADAENLPFKDNTFDAVITSQFVMHTPYYEKIIKEMTRVAKKQGSIIIDFPNKVSISYFPTKIRLLAGKLRNFNMFTEKQIREIAKKNNLQIKEIRGTVVFPPMALPEFLSGFSKTANKLLVNLFPGLVYTYYVHFIKK